MYKVRAWAHNVAHGPQPTNDGAVANQNEQQAVEPEKNTPKVPFVRKFLHALKAIFFRTWLNVLLIFAPLGIAVHAAGVDPNVVFALNAIAVIPLAGLLTFATECLATRFSPTIAALLNVSFGNSVELIIFIIALVQGQIRIVQASLIGSILANLLLILGMAMTLGGLQYREQFYDSVVTQMSSSLLALSSLSLLIPTAFHASFSDLRAADDATLKLSRGAAVILLLVYALYMLFQLRSHAYMFEGTPQQELDSRTEPGILQRMNSTSSSSSDSTVSSRSTSVSTVSTGGTPSRRRTVKKALRARLGRKRKTKTEEEIIQEEEDISPDGPAPLPKERAVAFKEEQPQAGVAPETVREPAANAAVNLATATAPTAANAPAKRPFAPRGISVRAPPVFRTDSAAPQQATQSPFQMRRYNSAPNMAQQAGLFGAPSRANTGMSDNAVSQGLSRAQSSEEKPELDMWPAIILLLGSTALVAVCAEFMVSSIEHLVENSPLSEAFIGLIILPIVGNAAEHVTAVIVAAKNKLDLALGVALGSSIQIALLITPITIIIGWGLDSNMSLYFTLFETVCLFVAVFVVCFLCLDGRSNWLEGSLLCAAYIIIAVGAYFFPDSESQNLSTTPGGA